MSTSDQESRFTLGPMKNLPSGHGPKIFVDYKVAKILVDGEPLGISFMLDRDYEPGEFHKVSVFTDKNFAPHLKNAGLSKHWRHCNDPGGGLEWEWAGPLLREGKLPVESQDGHTFLSSLAQNFQKVMQSMGKTDHQPVIRYWSAPIVAGTLVSLGWPVNEADRSAWKDAYQAWEEYRKAKKNTPPLTKIIQQGANRWGEDKDGNRRDVFNFEFIAHPEREWLMEDEVFSQDFKNAMGLNEQPVVSGNGGPRTRI